MSAWPAIETSLRRALLIRGEVCAKIDAMLEALRSVVLAVERAGTRIDEDVAWALLAAEADRQRRACQARETRRRAS